MLSINEVQSLFARKDEHAGPGYSIAFAGKNLQTCGLYFFRQVPNTPLPPCVQECHRANKLQKAIIRIKKNIAL